MSKRRLKRHTTHIAITALILYALLTTVAVVILSNARGANIYSTLTAVLIATIFSAVSGLSTSWFCQVFLRDYQYKIGYEKSSRKYWIFAATSFAMSSFIILSTAALFLSFTHGTIGNGWSVPLSMAAASLAVVYYLTFMFNAMNRQWAKITFPILVIVAAISSLVTFHA